jgi:hypothetical protein
MHTTNVNVMTGEIVHIPYTAEEQAKHDARVAAYAPPTAPPIPTKEQLLAQLNLLSAQIQALE